MIGRGVKIQCHICSRFYALKKDGTFRFHKSVSGDCEGSDKKPLPNAQMAEER